MAWTDPTLNSTIKMKHIHISELRSAVEVLEAACATHNSTNNTSKHGTVYSGRYASVHSSNRSSVNSSYNSSITGGYSACVHNISVH